MKPIKVDIIESDLFKDGKKVYSGDVYYVDFDNGERHLYTKPEMKKSEFKNQIEALI